MERSFDEGTSVGAIFIDPTIDLDTLNFDLLIAKLEAQGFSESFLNYIQNYLDNLLQSTNVNNNFGLWKDIFAYVPKGSILGSLMFNIYINEILLSGNNAYLSNYANDTTLYLVQESHNTNRNIFKKKFLSLQNWFYDN